MPYLACLICENKFYTKPNWILKGFGKYCSRACSAKSQLRGKIVRCAVCNVEIWRKPKDLKNSKSGSYFCNKRCQAIWRNKLFSGKNHPNWKNGRHQAYRQFLLNSNTLQVCVVCKSTDKRVLVVHHIDKDRSNNSLDNLMWLCMNCHFIVHNFD